MLNPIWNTIAKWFKRKPAPAPDLGQLGTYSSHTVLREMFARDRAYGAAITRDAQGIYRVATFTWFTEDWTTPGCSSAYWVYDPGDSLMDTFVAAMQLAEEKISEYEARKGYGAL